MGIKKTLIKNSFFNLAAYAYLLLAAFFSIPIILNSLGSDLFGIYVLLASIVPLVSVFDLGLGNAVVRELSLPNLPKKDYVSAWRTSFWLFSVIGFLLSLFVFGLLRLVPNYWDIFRQINSHTLGQLGFIIALTVFFNHLNAHLLNLPQARQQFDIFNLKTILVGTGNTIITALAATITRNLADLFLIQFTFHFITFILLVVYAKGIFPGWDFFPSFKKKTALRLTIFGLKNFVGAVSNQVEAQASKYVIGARASALAITAFSIPQNIILKAAGAISQIAIVIFPTGTSLLTKDRMPKLTKLILLIESLTLIFGLVGIIGIYSFGGQFLLWWLKNPAVVNLATPVLRVMSFYLLLTALTPIPTVVLIGLNYPQIPSLFALLTAAIEIVLLIILVPAFQAVGAAYAVVGSASITVPSMLFVFWYLYRKQSRKIQSPVGIVSPPNLA